LAKRRCLSVIITILITLLPIIPFIIIDGGNDDFIFFWVIVLPCVFVSGVYSLIWYCKCCPTPEQVSINLINNVPVPTISYYTFYGSRRKTQRFSDGLKEIVNEQVQFYPQNFQPTRTLKEIILEQGVTGEQAIQWASNRLQQFSTEQIACIYLYTIESPFYKELNRVMREGSNEERTKYRDFIFYLNEILNLLPSHVGSVYRGISSKVAGYTNGKFVVWPAFSSATRNPIVAHGFMRGQEGTLFLIQSTSAKPISEYSAESSEDEVLFHPNSKFKVVSKVKKAEKKCCHLCWE